MTFNEFLSLPSTHINAIINRYGKLCYDKGYDNDDYPVNFDLRQGWPLFDDFIANINKSDLQL